MIAILVNLWNQASGDSSTQVIERGNWTGQTVQSVLVGEPLSHLSVCDCWMDNGLSFTAWTWSHLVHLVHLVAPCRTLSPPVTVMTSWWLLLLVTWAAQLWILWWQVHRLTLCCQQPRSSSRRYKSLHFQCFCIHQATVRSGNKSTADIVIPSTWILLVSKGG